MAEDFSLAPGAGYRVSYRINASKDAELEGIYKGMALIGTETALVFDTDSGRTYLNASSIVGMRQVAAAPEEPRKKGGEDRALYG